MARHEPITTIEEARASTRSVLTVAEVARIADVNPRTVNTAIQAGHIPVVRMGRRIVIPRDRFVRLFDGDAMDADEARRVAAAES